MKIRRSALVLYDVWHEGKPVHFRHRTSNVLPHLVLPGDSTGMRAAIDTVNQNGGITEWTIEEMDFPTCGVDQFGADDLRNAPIGTLVISYSLSAGDDRVALCFKQLDGRWYAAWDWEFELAPEEIAPAYHFNPGNLR